MIKFNHPKAFDQDHTVVICDCCMAGFVRQGLDVKQVFYEFCNDCMRLAVCLECGEEYQLTHHPMTRCPKCGQVSMDKAKKYADYLWTYYGALLLAPEPKQFLKIIKDAKSDEEWLTHFALRLASTPWNIAKRMPL